MSNTTQDFSPVVAIEQLKTAAQGFATATTPQKRGAVTRRINSLVAIIKDGENYVKFKSYFNSLSLQEEQKLKAMFPQLFSDN